jgi:hypothetical protein
MTVKGKVTRMKAKEYLEQVQMLDEMINQDVERLHDMKLQSTSTGAIRYDKDHVQTSPTGDALCRAVTNYVAFEDDINAEIDRFVDIKTQVIEEIRGLRVLNYVKILYKVYVQYKSIRQAAKEMKMSYSYVIELHKKALIAFEETYTNLHYLT